MIIQFDGIKLIALAILILFALAAFIYAKVYNWRERRNHK